MPKSKNSKRGAATVPKKFKTPLLEAIKFLEKSDCRYALIGGLALSQWGVVRATHDVDFKVLVPDTDYSRIRALLSAQFPKPARKHAPKNPLILAVKIAGVTVDFLFALPGYEELIIEHAIRRTLNGFSAWICSAEDLVIQKVVAGREKDWPDVEALLIAQSGKLDSAYIDDWLVQFAEALEKPEMLAKYRRLVERISKL